MLNVAVDLSCCDKSAMHYVITVLWINHF